MMTRKYDENNLKAHQIVSSDGVLHKLGLGFLNSGNRGHRPKCSLRLQLYYGPKSLLLPFFICVQEVRKKIFFLNIV